MSVDPLADKYPSWNPYAYTLNNPVRLVDRDGMEAEDIIVDGVTWTLGAKGEGESKFVQQTFAALNQLVSDPDAGKVSTKERTGHVILDFVGENAIGDVEIIQGGGLGSFHETSEDGKTINFSEDIGVFIQSDNSDNGKSGGMSPATLLGHEFAHAWLAQGSPKLNAGFEKADGHRLNLGKGSPNEHRWVLKVERSFAKAAGETLRKRVRSASFNKASSISPSGLFSPNDYFYKTRSSTSIKPK